MVGDVARVVEAVASVVRAIANDSEEVIDANQIYTSFMVAVVKLLKPVVWVI